jgi:RNase H-fold protein (predicted Holliday junction resolvase)
MLFFSLADIIARHRAHTIIIGMPARQKDVQEKIQEFVKQLRYVIHQDTEIKFIEEDYTSVQSGEIVSNFKKNVAEDTVSAMIILERRLQSSEAGSETNSVELL